MARGRPRKIRAEESAPSAQYLHQKAVLEQNKSFKKFSKELRVHYSINGMKFLKIESLYDKDGEHLRSYSTFIGSMKDKKVKEFARKQQELGKLSRMSV